MLSLRSHDITQGDTKMIDLFAHAKKVVIETKNEKRSSKNIQLVIDIYRILLQDRQMERFSEYFSSNLQIYKDFEKWDYATTERYGKHMLEKYDRVSFLPFEIVIACDEYVTARYIGRLENHGKVEKEIQFTSVYHISPEGKIDRIDETSSLDPKYTVK